MTIPRSPSCLPPGAPQAPRPRQIGVFCAGLLLALACAAPAALDADIIEQILVKVNGDIFTKTDLEARQVAALRQRGQPIDLKSEQGDAQLRKALDEITPQIIVDVVDEMLIVQRGHELG